ncbi:MAG: CARDB domain-containing protein [Candidatus Peregrinibacteria bacterium]
MPPRPPSRFPPLLFWGTIGLVALLTTFISLRNTSVPLQGELQIPVSQIIDHHSPRPAFKLFGPWYRTKNFDFTRARWTSKAQYNFSNIQPGIYKVEASYLPYALFAHAPYTIKEGENILAEASVDQSVGAAPGTRPTEQWVQIATDLTINGPDLTAEVTSPATPGATASVMARGVRLTYLRPLAVCGNGIREQGETCDDGDRDDGDGCSALCAVEIEWVCPVAGQSCVSNPNCIRKTAGTITATLCADAVMGEQPFPVLFTFAATDTAGTVLSYDLDVTGVPLKEDGVKDYSSVQAGSYQHTFYSARWYQPYHGARLTVRGSSGKKVEVVMDSIKVKPLEPWSETVWGFAPARPNPFTGDPASPYDLDVTYIERTPRYESIWYGSLVDRLKPAIGEEVTLVAHIINRGRLGTPPSDYEWRLDGEVVSTGGIPALDPGQEFTASIPWAWAYADTVVSFFADAENRLQEKSEKNNLRVDKVNARIVSFHVEQSVYDLHNTQEYVALNDAGLGEFEGNSFEDLAQRWVDLWNKSLATAVYPGNPHGILERIRLDKVVVHPDGWYETINPNHAVVKHDFTVQWQLDFAPSTAPYLTPDVPATIAYTPPAEQILKAPNKVPYTLGYSIIPGLNIEVDHDISHMLLGTSDLYNAPQAQNIKVSDDAGNRLFLPEDYPQLRSRVAWSKFADDIVGTRNVATWGEFNAGSINYRRLAYPEKLDLQSGEANVTPKTNFLRLSDRLGNAIPNAEVKVYTTHMGGAPEQNMVMDDTPDLVGTTDAAGRIFIPQPIALCVESPKYPLFINVRAYGQTGYAWMFPLDFCVAYFRGQQEEAVYDIRLPIMPPTLVLNAENVALGKPATGHSMLPEPGDPASLVDGDASEAAPAWAGDAWTVDLGTVKNVYKVVVTHGRNDGAISFATETRVQFSETGLFQGEEITSDVYGENAYGQWDTSTILRVGRTWSLFFEPTRARYVRLWTNDQYSMMRDVQEVQVFEATEPSS